MVEHMIVETTGIIGSPDHTPAHCYQGGDDAHKYKPREPEWLFQHISLTILQGSAFPFRLLSHEAVWLTGNCMFHPLNT